MKKPFVSEIFAQLAKETGVKVNLDPDYKFAGQIILPDGRKRYFRDTHMDINPLGAAEIADDKDYAAYFIAKLGYPVVTGRKFYSKEWCGVIHSRQGLDATYRYARKIGFPVIVKPNNSSQGHGVAKVYTRRDFYQAARFILAKNRLMLVQQVLEGKDYRLVVLDDKVISAYERIPLSVTGDSCQTIGQLICSKQKEFDQSGRDTQLNPTDFRIKMKLARQKLSMQSVPPKDQKVFLLDNANLSSGGEAVDVTDKISDSFSKIAINLTREMNLRYCGVDLMTTDSIETSHPKNYTILEINAAPGLDHYAHIGPKQTALVRNLYRKVLEAFKKD